MLADELIGSFRKEEGNGPLKYFWELKLSRNEYERLKDEIALHKEYFQRERYERVQEDSGIDKDVALFYSEWWRREDSIGRSSEKISQLIFDSKEFARELEKAAIRGFENLGFDSKYIRLEKADREQRLYTALYDGGLPMQRIVGDIQKKNNTPLSRFFKGLAWGEADFDAIPGQTAQRSDSLRDFSDRIRRAANANMSALLPFEYNKEWWDVIVRDFEDVKKERRRKNPFNSRWTVQFNDHNCTAVFKLSISFPRSISKEFLADMNLNDGSLHSFTLFKNGVAKCSAQYDSRNRNRRASTYAFDFKLGDVFTLRSDVDGKVIKRLCFDFDSLETVECIDEYENMFSGCDVSKVRQQDIRVITTAPWSLEEIGYKEYDADGYTLRVFDLSATDAKLQFKLEGTDTVCEIAEEQVKTEVDARCSFNYTKSYPVLEEIYDASQGCVDARSKQGKTPTVKYADYGSSDFGDNPSIGQIRARLDYHDGKYCTPVRFYNVGNLDMKIVHSDADKCSIRFVWKSPQGDPYGSITAKYITSEDIDPSTGEDEVLEFDIMREQMQGARTIAFTFHTKARYGTSFTLNIIPQFNAFRIFDYNGNAIPKGAVIPLSDLSSYRYSLYMAEGESKRMSFKDMEGVEYKYSAADNGIEVEERIGDLSHKTRIPNEGSLSNFFYNGEETVNLAIESRCADIPNMKLPFKLGEDNYKIQHFPYHLEQCDDIVKFQETRRLKPYPFELRAVPIEDPSFTPVKLVKNEDGTFSIPQQMRDSGYNDWFAYGTASGYVMPARLVLDRILDMKQRKSDREQILGRIKEELSAASPFSERWNKVMQWYSLSMDGNICGSSLLDLVAATSLRELMLKFAFCMWFKDRFDYNVEDDQKGMDLISNLVDFQNEMSFLWDWNEIRKEEIERLVKDYLNGLPKESEYDLMFALARVGWASEHAEIEQKEEAFFENCVQDFIEWFNVLRFVGNPLNRHAEWQVLNLKKDVKEYYLRWSIYLREQIHSPSFSTYDERSDVSDVQKKKVDDFVLRYPLSTVMGVEFLENPDMNAFHLSEDAETCVGNLMAFPAVRQEIGQYGNMAANDKWICERRALSNLFKGGFEPGKFIEESACREICKNVILGLKYKTTYDNEI